MNTTKNNEKKAIDCPLICKGNHFDWDYYDKFLKENKIIEPEVLRERK